MIEVLIVLGVTGGLFVSASILIIGRQNRTAFEQAVRNVYSQIQSAVDEVAIGHYPNNGNIQCTATVTGPDLSAGSNPQGTNGGCIFMGKVIQFGVASTDPEQFKTYTIAGLRNTAAGVEVRLRTEAVATMIAPTTADPSIPDEVTEVNLEAGLTTAFIQYGPLATPTATGGISIWQSLGRLSGTSLNSGAQFIQTGPIPGTTLGMSQQEFADAASATIATAPLDQVEGVRLCFVSGSTNQSGLITLGANNRRTVTLDMKSNRTCS